MARVGPPHEDLKFNHSTSLHFPKAFILHDHLCEDIECLIGFIVLAVRTSNPARQLVAVKYIT